MAFNFNADSKNLTPGVQSQTADYLQKTLMAGGAKDPSFEKSVVMDSAIVQDRLHSSDAPELIQEFMGNLDEEVTFAGGQKKSPALLVMDGIARAAALYEFEHGRKAPDAVFDTAIRSALPIVSQRYAEAIGIVEKVGVFDDVGNISGGAMRVGQILVAVTQAFAEDIPFGGQIAMGKGLEGRIFQINHQAGNDVGAYKTGDKLDGLNAGKPFMQNKRKVTGEFQDGKWIGLIKHYNGDAVGCPIRSDTATVYVNGLIVASANPDAKRGTPINISNTFTLAKEVTKYNVNLTCSSLDNGVLEAVFTPALPEGCKVTFTADVDYENKFFIGGWKRPQVETIADSVSIRAHFASGLYQISQEARVQWSADVGMDPAAHSSLALRNQLGAERHNMATSLMYDIGQAYQTSFSLDWTNRLAQRDIASIVHDMSFIMSQVDMEMIARTQLSRVGVIYVGQSGVKYFDSMPPEVFKPSGVPARAGVYRLGKWLNKYDVYFSPIPELNPKTADSFQMLCIGRSDQVGANPYITGYALGAQLLPMNVTSDGKSGQFYFQAVADSVNPWSNLASAAAIVNVINAA